MNIWIDAQLPPTLGTPPQILWLTCGNVTNRNLRQLLTLTLPDALERLRQGEMIVEISE